MTSSMMPPGFGRQEPGLEEQRRQLLEQIGPNRRMVGAFEGQGHQIDQADIDADQLQQDFARRLGRDVALTMRVPTSTEPGELRILDAGNGAQLEVDELVVRTVLAAHAAPESNKQQFVREFDESDTDADRLRAFRDYVARDLAEDEYQQGRRRVSRDALSRPRRVAVQALRRGSAEPTNRPTVTEL